MKKVLKWIGIVLLGLVIIGAIFGGGDNDEKTPVADVSKQETKVSEEQKKEEALATETKEIDLSQPKTEVFILNGSDKGQYGFDFTLGENTPNAYTYLAYKIPSGKYKITNISKKYANQVNVYTDAKHMVGDYEECVGGTAELLNPGQSVEMNVTDTAHIKIVPNEENIGFSFERIGDAEVTVSTEAPTSNDSNTIEIGKKLTFGDYDIIITKFEKTKDYENKDVLKITYDFTNNSDKETQPFLAIVFKAFQNGVEVDEPFMSENVDLGIAQKTLKPGADLKGCEAMVGITDLSQPLELELKELISFSNDKYTITLDLNNI